MLRTLFLSVLLSCPASLAVGQGALKLTTSATPTAAGLDLTPLFELPEVRVDAPDRNALAQEDQTAAAEGEPPRYAVAHKVEITPFSDGLWEQVDNVFLVWRLRVSAPLAASINLGFTEYDLPPKARLLIHDALDARIGPRPFTALDNAAHGELWTPPIPS